MALPRTAVLPAVALPLVATLPAADVPSVVSIDVFLSYWWIFPASVLFSTIAISAGVSGALFFSPFFLFAVGLTPAQAIGAGLLTEVFGMGNGLRSYVRQGLVDYTVAKWLLVGALPAIVLGAFLAHRIDHGLLLTAFGIGLLSLGGFLVVYTSPERAEAASEYVGGSDGPWGSDERVVEARDGTIYRYPACSHAPGVGLATVGGFVTGLISAGLPEITTTQLVVRCRIPPRVAVATSVFVLAIAALAGATVHALSATPAWYAVGWSIPGVLVGSTVGSHLGKYVPGGVMESALGVVFGVVGLFVLLVEVL